jgi:Spy/CpxP family protein refolding chaperone
MKKLGRIQTLAIAGLSALALSTSLVLAQTGGSDQGPRSGAHGEHHGGDSDGKRGGGGDHMGGGMFRGLDLTDDQKTKLQQLHQSFGERTKSLREQLRAKHEELRQAESGTTFNETLATQKLTEAAGIEAKLMGEEFRLHQDMLSILTPEQRTKMEQHHQEMEQHREQFKGRHGGEHPGEQEQQ